MKAVAPRAAREPTSAWTRGQLAAFAIAQALAAALVAFAWWQARDVDELGDQVPWLNLAVLGLVASTSAIGGLLLVGRRAVGVLIAEVVPVLAPMPLATAPRAFKARELWVPGTSRVHRPGCQLIAGKAAVAVNQARRQQERLRDCAVCH